jgi:GAF domain-containing protein
MNMGSSQEVLDEWAGAAGVLFVGDHAAIRLVADSLVEPVHTVSEIFFAFERVASNKYAVVVIDLDVCPPVEGELLMRVQELTAHTAVIFLAASSSSRTVDARILRSGIADLVLKPFEAQLLGAKIRTFLTLEHQKRDLFRIRALYDADRRLTRKHLQTLTQTSARLATCMTTDEVVQTFISEAHQAVGAVNSFVYLRSNTDERLLELAAVRGIEPESLNRFQRLRVDESWPVTAAINTLEAVWVSDQGELVARFPSLIPRGYIQAVVALPVTVSGVSIGAVAFSFSETRVWDIDKREFYLTCVAAFVAALERARLLRTEREAHQELERQSDALRLLADVGILLSSSLDYESVLRQLTELLVPRMADWCTVDVLDFDGRIRRLAAHHFDSHKLEILRNIERRFLNESNRAHGSANVLRTGELEWLPEVPDTVLSAIAQNDEHLSNLRSLGVGSYVAIPLKARGRTLGALFVVMSESGRKYSLDQVRYLEELAGRAALSLDNAKLFKEQVDAREALEKQARRALLAGDVGTALTRSDGLQDALTRCAEAMLRHLGGATACIWTVDSRGEALELQACVGAKREQLCPACSLPIATSRLGHVVRCGEPYLTNSLGLTPWGLDSLDGSAFGMAAFACYPLIVDASVTGAMTLFSNSDLPDDTLAGLAGIADAVAIGIDRARADRRARVERETLEVVNQVGRALAAELDHEKLAQSVTDYATQLAGAQFGAFFCNVEGRETDGYVLYALSGVGRDVFSSLNMPSNTQVFAPTFSGECAVRLDDIRQDPRYGHNAPHSGAPDGHLEVASYLAVPVVSRTGAVIGGLFFGHSQPGLFTERHELLVVGVAAQAAVALDNARLFKEAQRLIAELDKSNTELDQFAYVASHDLKAPLRGISNLSQWLEEDLGPAVTPAAKGQLSLLRNRVQRLEGLINGILNYSRAGRVRDKVEPVAVGKLLIDTVEMISIPFGATIEIEQGMPEIVAERVPLQQVFMNLLNNALKHSKRSDPHVKCGFKDARDFVEFAVLDNGPGIAPEFHERIWGIFQTLEPRDVVEGTGIGLSVVKKIVENKGGRVGVESSQGAGAKFWFTWPKSEKANSNG